MSAGARIGVIEYLRSTGDFSPKSADPRTIGNCPYAVRGSWTRRDPAGAGDRDRTGPEGSGCLPSIIDLLCSPYELLRRLSVLETIVGSAAAEKVLLYLQSYEQAYGREISATFELSNSQVQKQLLKLESGGLLVSRRIGRTRLYQWNPRNPLVPSLRAFLAVALDSLPANEQQQFFRKRTRPRRSGKAL